MINNFLTQKNVETSSNPQTKKPTKGSVEKKAPKVKKQKLSQSKNDRTKSRTNYTQVRASIGLPSSQKGQRISQLFNTKEKEKKTDKKRSKNSRSSSREEIHQATRASVTSFADGRVKTNKRRDVSGENIISTIKEPGQNDTPILTHPSENIAHTYSFDIAIPNSQKNLISKGDNQYSISSLQQ